jgi:hypothetical protein
MTISQDDQNEQSTAGQAVDLSKVRAVLETRAQQIDEKIERLERATFVSQETLRLEFKV